MLNFSDLSVDLSYEDLSESSVATLVYNYQDVVVGTAEVTIDPGTTSSYDFASDDLTYDKEAAQEDAETLTDAEKEKSVVFIYVNRVFYWILGIVIVIIVGLFLRSVFHNYHFEKKSRKKRRRRYTSNSRQNHMGTRSQRKVRADQKRKRRKDTRIRFDYGDFQDLE